jgi:ribosomal protein S18 acetylase RimI-like enzyme
MHPIESVARRAWPAASETWHGNWLVRTDVGYTKRANAIYAWGGEPDLDLASRIADTTAALESQGLPTVFRVATNDPVPGLADHLIMSGFSRIDDTRVMTSLLNGKSGEPARAIDMDTWMDGYARFEGGTKGNQVHHRAILERITSPIRLAARYDGDDLVAIGLAVVDGDHVGLFDIATDPARRGQGHGHALVSGMLDWGASQGATTAYLQVMETNAPAIRLYERLGFQSVFGYHYYVRRSS